MVFSPAPLSYFMDTLREYLSRADFVLWMVRGCHNPIAILIRQSYSFNLRSLGEMKWMVKKFVN